jgi:Tfp pilus assembly protein PilX
MSSPRNTRSAPSPRRTERERGSALITVLVLAAAIAVIAGHLFVRGLQEQRLATRSYYLSVALNLAEAGIEEAMWAANNGWIDATRGWADAGDGTTAKVRSTTSGLALAQGAGEIRVRIDNPTSNTPSVTALGLVRLPNQSPVVKQLRVALTRRTTWANAIVAKGSVTFNGNRVSIDAYDSAVGAWHATTNRLDQATVATNSATNAGLSVNNADIYGSVATGGAPPSVGPNGSILGATSPSGLADNIDPARVRRDFAYNIPDAVAPSGATSALGAVNTSLTLPRPGDTPGSDGRYRYDATQIDLSNKTLTIEGPVDLIVSGNVTIGSGAAIAISAAGTAALALYTDGNVSIQGNGAVNPSGAPTRLALYGTRTEAEAATLGAQSFDLRGNADYYGLVYAPNADVALRGGGSSGTFSGAIIGRTVTFNGNYNFHYDVRLGGLSSERYFRPTSWIELTAPAGSGAALARDDRAPFTGHL